MSHSTNRRGFSLLEMLIYTALVALIATIIIESFIPLARSYAVLIASSRVSASGSAALERIVREVRDASAVGAGSTFGSSPGTLVLTSFPQDRTITLSSGRVQLQEGTGVPYPLTASNVVVSKLIFYSIQNGTNSRTISIDMELESTVGSTTRLLPLRASAILRNAY